MERVFWIQIPPLSDFAGSVLSLSSVVKTPKIDRSRTDWRYSNWAAEIRLTRWADWRLVRHGGEAVRGIS
jgi:hypothetical protein